MDKQYTQLRIWKDSLKKLRLIYADTGESMISIVDRLAAQELKRINEHRQDIQVQTLSVKEE